MSVTNVLQTLNALVKLVVGVSIGLLFLGFGIGSDKSMPRNAVIYLDHNQREYLAPHCTKPDYQYVESTVDEAYRLKYAPQHDCRESGAFRQVTRSLSGSLLEKIGILPPLESRWNADGSWNW